MHSTLARRCWASGGSDGESAEAALHEEFSDEAFGDEAFGDEAFGDEARGGVALGDVALGASLDRARDAARGGALVGNIMADSFSSRFVPSVDRCSSAPARTEGASHGARRVRAMPRAHARLARECGRIRESSRAMDAVRRCGGARTSDFAVDPQRVHASRGAADLW
jgi:hypothetical protein